jgi:general secretion pathway protein K
MRAREQAGFALLIVIWSLVLLSFILAHVLSAGRGEVELARNLRAAMEAEPVADGAVQNTIFHLLDPSPQHWPLQGRHSIILPGGVADVRIEDVAGEINPNTADETLLDAALTLCGVSGNAMVAIANASMAWRAPLRATRWGRLIRRRDSATLRRGSPSKAATRSALWSA